MALLQTEGGALMVPYGVGGRDDHSADMERLTQLEQASDELLRRHGVRGVYTDDDLTERIRAENAEALRTAREIGLGADVEFSESLLETDEPPRVTLYEVISAAHLTARQRQAVRLMRKHGRQALVAEAMGVLRPAVSKLLARAYLRIKAAYPALKAATPTQIGLWLWREEQAKKRRQVYRKPSGGHKSAYLHDRRWRRRRK
jgi:hypothetical protein